MKNLCLISGNALNCYECNSHKDGRGCIDKEMLKNFSVPCNAKPDENKYVACRKITQTIDFEVNGCKYVLSDRLICCNVEGSSTLK